VTDFTRASRIRDILARDETRGRDLLFQHGFDLGEGFVDVLSQYQTLETAYRTGRLRDVDQLLAQLNSQA
jgi:hypothetical protein